MNIKNRRNDNIEVGGRDQAGLCQWWLENKGVQSTDSGKLNCNGDVLYSYSIPIARLVQNQDTGSIACLITSVRYSTTTDKQIKVLTDELQSNDIINLIKVPNVLADSCDDHTLNLSWMMQQARDTARLIDVVKSDEQFRLETAVELGGWLTQIKKYIEVFSGRDIMVGRELLNDLEKLHDLIEGEVV